jgi:hypothetical protein
VFANCKIDDFELMNVTQGQTFSFMQDVGFRKNHLQN